jgi:spermidine synthase
VAGKLRLALAAAACGASGLGLEVLIVSLCGLTLGYGTSAAVGLTVFLIGWSLGALLSGRTARGSKRVLWAAGVTLALAAGSMPVLLIRLGAEAPAAWVTWSVSLAALWLVAVPQGVFLPQLASRWRSSERGDVGLLLGSNLLGAASGAWFLGAWLPAAEGRILASLAAGGLALLAALLGTSVEVVPSGAQARPAAPTTDAPASSVLSLRRAGVYLALATGWLGTLEWLGLRLGVLWLGGMQPALTGVLIASMLALALGAWVGPKVVGRGARGRGMLVLGGLLGTSWWVVAPWALERTSSWPLVARALVLIGPTLLPFGAVVPVLHRDLFGESGERLGRLFAWEALGALVGLPVSFGLLLPALGLNGTLAAWALLAGALFLALGLETRALRVGLLLLGMTLAVGLGRFLRPLALSSPALSNPALEVLDFTEDRHFAVAVVEDGVLGERTVMTDGFRAAGTGRDYSYMKALGHLPLLLHPDPARVAVLAFGTGTTAGSVALHPEVRELDVLEISAAVASRAHWFEEVNHGSGMDAAAWRRRQVATTCSRWSRCCPTLRSASTCTPRSSIRVLVMLWHPGVSSVSGSRRTPSSPGPSRRSSRLSPRPFPGAVSGCSGRRWCSSAGIGRPTFAALASRRKRARSAGSSSPWGSRAPRVSWRAGSPAVRPGARLSAA